MFGLGFTEILMIAIVALLFIGPDKLPDTMKTIARTLGKAKRMFDETKSTLENELRVDDLREEALHYKRQIEDSKAKLASFKNVAHKEIQEIKNEASLASLEDSASLGELFDEAEEDFNELEESSQQETTQKDKQITQTDNSTSTKSGFKHLKAKES